MSEAEIEEMIQDCMDVLEESDAETIFTNWERNFLMDVSEKQYTTHLSQAEIAKVEEIWIEKL